MTIDRAADYVAGIRAFAGKADYFAINVSSPKHAEPARPAEARSPGRSPRPRAGRPRRRGRGWRPQAGPAEDRARPVAGRPRRDRRGWRAPGAKRRRHDRLEHHDHPARARSAMTAPASRPAACRDDRCSTSRPACSRQPFCGSNGSSRWSASAAWTARRRPGTKIEAGATLVQLYSALVFQGPGWSPRSSGACAENRWGCCRDHSRDESPRLGQGSIPDVGLPIRHRYRQDRHPNRRRGER